jgi:hypothetical protein
MNTLTIHEKILIGQRVNASYHEAILPIHKSNPLVESLPRARTQEEVRDLFSRGAPEYRPEERNRAPMERRQLVHTLFNVFVPLRRHARIEEAVMDSIIHSYSYRNPLAKRYMIGQIETAEGIDFKYNDGEEPMIGTASVIGSSGTGKTRTAKRTLLRACPQVIRHTNYKGQDIALDQITWLYVSCAHDGSVKDLCCNIAGAMDIILIDPDNPDVKTDYKKLVEAKKTEHAMARELASITAMHAVGLIVVDEVQNACIGRPLERQRLTRFLTKLMNSMSTRIMLVGTPEANDAVMSDIPLLRRTIGESGQISWDRLVDPLDWKQFLKGIWKYQYTSTETELTPALMLKMWQLTLGIPDLAVKLYCMAQKEVIGHPDYPNEPITPEILEYVMSHRMERAEKVLQLMRRDPENSAEWNHPNFQQLLLDIAAAPNFPTATKVTDQPLPPAIVTAPKTAPSTPAMFDLMATCRQGNHGNTQESV